ncbi:DUF930 domain-containing protein [Mesorhizobium marinum]|uniref:DUF930 domain-containing protein n=1 Tax=Mesorhizobium marinum TaxID=3228790 RepID=UPI003465E841
MSDSSRDQKRTFGWGFPASLAAHLVAAFLLIFGLPVLPFEAEQEQAISVDLVPPEPQEEAKAPPPEPEKPPEAKAEEAPPPEGNAEPPPQSVLRPVFQFGEKDAGPKLSPGGDSAREGQAPSPAERAAEEQKAAAPQALAAANADEQTQQAPEAPAPKAEHSPDAPADEADKAAQAKPEEGGTLSSHAATGDIVATTAINEVPRGVRAGRLCVTELREQMRNALPPYYPDLLPSYRLTTGTTIDAQKAAFRMNGEWYNLSYRCEVDDDATRVLSFVYQVGGRVPPGEAARRGLPLR